jgi:DNA-binding transcriptional regulator YdaS (Cro superfamily)
MTITPARITKAAALAVFGNRVSALAAALGVTRAAVSQWRDGPIPENRSRQLRYELRPDVDWDALIAQSERARSGNEPYASG